MQLLHSLVNSGIAFATTTSGKRGVKLSNSIALMLFGISLVVCSTYYGWFGWNMLTLLIPVIGLSALIVPVLNAMGLINVSRIWLSIGPMVLITFLSIYSKSIYYAQQQELDYFTFRMVMLGSCVMPWVVFSLKERTALVVTSALGIAIILAHDPLHWAFGVPYPQGKLKVMNYYYTNIIVFITFAIITASLGFLRFMSEKNEEKNIELIEDLALTNKILLERNAEVEAQTAEILAQSDVLHESQNQLIEANRLINEQRKQLFSRNQSLESELIEKNLSLTDMNDELIKHNNELRQFSYTVSHNLRGPVASLLGLIGLIEVDTIPDKDKEVFEHFKTATHQLDQIIKDISKIIDIRHDIFKIRQKIDLDAEIVETMQLLRREIESHDIRIVRNLEAIPCIYSIKPMVNSIIYNLISNAIKYRSSERPPVITISSGEDDQFYILEVEDNGLGIDLNQNRESLFKLYKRFHYHTEGKGLGLFLVKLQCESLGGGIEVESEINRYTRFVVKLKKPVNIDRQVLLNEPYAEIFYDANINATGVIWKTEVTSEQYRSVFRKCLEFVKYYNTPNYISDISKQGPVPAADQRWMFAEILPPAVRSGLKRIAAVRGDLFHPLIGQYYSGINETVLKLGAEQRYFATRQDAFDWLHQENQRTVVVSLQQ